MMYNKAISQCLRQSDHWIVLPQGWLVKIRKWINSLQSPATIRIIDDTMSLVVTDLVHNHPEHGVLIAPPLYSPMVIQNRDAFKVKVAIG